MSGFVTVVLFFAGMAVFAWAFRAVARALKPDEPVFRDMPYATAFGYIWSGCYHGRDLALCVVA